MRTQKQTRHTILMAALDLHETVEMMSPVHWEALELSVPGDLARKLRALSDAVFADQDRRGNR